jgi:hypothetical protein
MWSDPPPSAVDQFCYFYCTDAGTTHLQTLLDDPANDSKSYNQLAGEAMRVQMAFLQPRLTAAARAAAPGSMNQDPAFGQCEPYGLLRQMFALHQLEIKQYPDRVVLHYGEWDARRNVYLDGRAVPAGAATLLGHSVGHYEGETLVVESTHARANLSWWMAGHSEQLKTVERYSLSPDKKRLELRVKVTDPWGVVEPIEVKKGWGWAPQEKIYPYVDCELPGEELRTAK